LKASSRKFISLLLKIVIALAAFFFIYKRLVFQNDSLTIWFNISSINIGVWITILGLMLVNWFVEVTKWIILSQSIEPIGFSIAIKAILIGVTLSVFTPNRVGEVGGKILFMQPENRGKGLFLSMIGSLSQLLITIIFGLLGGMYYLKKYTPFYKNITDTNVFLLELLVVSILIFLLVVFFRLSRLSKIILTYSFFRPLQKYVKGISELSFLLLLKILSLSFLRYLVFSYQYYLLLKVCGVSISYFSGLMMIALTFFSISLVPTIAISEIGVRGSAAVIFLGLLSTNTSGIVAASFLTWVVNIAIPAIVGVLFVFQVKLFNGPNS